MNTLPTKRDPAEPGETDPPNTWREVGQRVRDLLSDFVREGKALERELEPRLLPALKRLKRQIEKLITRLEERAGKKRP